LEDFLVEKEVLFDLVVLFIDIDVTHFDEDFGDEFDI
jgi:hypothetical protein